jgi:peptidase inhibitor family I36
METADAINKRVVQAVLAITLAVLAVPVVAGLIIDSKQLGDTLAILGLLLFLLMIVGVAAIWILRQLPRGKTILNRFWVAGPTLALLLMVIPGTIAVPRLVGFWNNIGSGHPADGTPPTVLSPGIATADSTSKIACGDGHVCIYPEANYGGVPYVLRATDDSTSLADTPINDKTFSVVNNGGSPRTARIYRSESYSGSHTCIQPGGRIADLRGFAVGQWGSSLKLNDDRCG